MKHIGWCLDNIQIVMKDMPKELTSEYDKVSKELRLARQCLEKLNHTTET